MCRGPKRMLRTKRMNRVTCRRVRVQTGLKGTRTVTVIIHWWTLINPPYRQRLMAGCFGPARRLSPCESESRVRSGCEWAADRTCSPETVVQTSAGRPLSPPYPAGQRQRERKWVRDVNKCSKIVINEGGETIKSPPTFFRPPAGEQRTDKRCLR